MHFDTTIHLSDLIIAGGVIGAFLKVWLAMRDNVFTNARDIVDLKIVTKTHEQEIRDHDEALVRMGWSKRMRNRALDEERT